MCVIYVKGCIMKFLIVLCTVTLFSSAAYAGAGNQQSGIVDMGLVTGDESVITDKDEEAQYVAEQERTPKPPLFIREILGKAKKDVDAVLGAPDGKCESAKQGLKCYYNGNTVDILFIKNKSDWITVHNPKVIGFYAGALEQIGIDCPIASGLVNVSRYAITWESTCKGILSASLFPGQGDDEPFRPISYIHIKVATP